MESVRTNPNKLSTPHPSDIELSAIAFTSWEVYEKYTDVYTSFQRDDIASDTAENIRIFIFVLCIRAQAELGCMYVYAFTQLSFLYFQTSITATYSNFVYRSVQMKDSSYPIFSSEERYKSISIHGRFEPPLSC